MDRERDPRFRTSDRVMIVDGLRVWDYDLLAGTVCFAESRIDSEYWDGWFRILRDDASTAIMNGVRLRTTHPFTGAPVPAGVDDLAPELRTALDDGAVLTVAGHDPVNRMPVLTWSPRVATDPAPWLDTVHRRRHTSTTVLVYPCDHCDQPATRLVRDGDEVLCRTHAWDRYGRWGKTTRPVSAGDVAERIGRM